MPKNRRRRFPRKQKRGNGLTNPLYQTVPMKRVTLPPALHTMSAWYRLQTGPLGVNGILFEVSATDFKNFGQMATFYRYYTVLSSRFDLTLSSRPDTLDSLDGASLAFYPINPILESPPSAAPTVLSDVQSLDGSMTVQTTGPNRSPWIKHLSPQVLSGAVAIGTNTKLGVFVAYVDDAGPNEVLGDIHLQVNMRFWGKRFTVT